MTFDDESRRVLVVEDDDDNRDVLVHMVQRLGHTADAARDGIEALAALTVESYDVMLLDMVMPRMSGEEVLRWLDKRSDVAAGLRLIVISASAEHYSDSARELGVHAVQPKPLRAQQLRELIGGGAAARRP